MRARQVVGHLRRELPHRHEDRRVADETLLAELGSRQLRHRVGRIPSTRLGDDLAAGRPRGLRQRRRQARQSRLHLGAGVPDLQGRLRGELGHRLTVGAHGSRGQRSPLLATQPVPATGDLETRREPLDVPLERSGPGLVEVVEVEDLLAFRRREEPEVGHVRVAAQLDRQAGAAHSPRGRPPSPPRPPGRTRRAMRASCRSGREAVPARGCVPAPRGSREGLDQPTAPAPRARRPAYVRWPHGRARRGRPRPPGPCPQRRRSPDCPPGHQASAFALSEANSSVEIAPESSSSLALAICSGAEGPAPATERT